MLKFVFEELKFSKYLSVFAKQDKKKTDVESLQPLKRAGNVGLRKLKSDLKHAGLEGSTYPYLFLM